MSWYDIEFIILYYDLVHIFNFQITVGPRLSESLLSIPAII